MNTAFRRVALRVFMIFLIAVSLGFVVWQIRLGRSQLAAQPLTVSPGLLAASLAVLLVNFLLVALVWRVVFRDRGESVRLRDTFAIIYAAQLGKYVPGKVWLFLGQVFLAEQLGYRKATALTATVVQNISGSIGAVIVIAVSLLGAGYDAWLFWVSLAVAAVGWAALIVMPVRIERWVNRWREKRGKEAIVLVVSPGAVARTVLLMTAAWVVHCAAFVLLVASLRPVGWTDACRLALAYNFAYHVAFYVLIVPGGIGVREGALTWLLNDRFGAGWAGIVSVVQRLWFTAAELIAFAISLALLGGVVRRKLWRRKKEVA
ncbi:MAG: lysylphosphatidylglycerol synthase domain-containing protein [Candidatus Lernaella stagnicola]|nr:lysylphosphatidylglycerol synthase domain-containing protein [Candidatus Lernaella stagnicola]